MPKNSSDTRNNQVINNYLQRPETQKLKGWSDEEVIELCKRVQGHYILKALLEHNEQLLDKGIKHEQIKSMSSYYTFPKIAEHLLSIQNPKKIKLFFNTKRIVPMLRSEQKVNTYFEALKSLKEEDFSKLSDCDQVKALLSPMPKKERIATQENTHNVAPDKDVKHPQESTIDILTRVSKRQRIADLIEGAEMHSLPTKLHKAKPAFQIAARKRTVLFALARNNLDEVSYRDFCAMFITAQEVLHLEPCDTDRITSFYEAQEDKLLNFIEEVRHFRAQP